MYMCLPHNVLLFCLVEATYISGQITLHIILSLLELMFLPTGLLDGVKEVLVKDLLCELSEVTNEWFNLGISLKIPCSKLQDIEQDYDDVEECKREMILLWRQLYVPTWVAMVTALAEIGMQSLAVKIAGKFGK